MRERLIGCLEQGGQVLHRTGPKLLHRRHRQLHSAFWSHGAGNIDLPSWWISLLQLPQAREDEEASKVTPGPRFLDFLYPSQTLSFIRRHATADPVVLRGPLSVRKVHQRSREYASIAAEDDEALSGNARAETRSENEEEPIASVVGSNTSEDVVRRENILARLDELLLQDHPHAQHRDLWQTYVDLRDTSVTLLPRQLVRMMRCLARSKAKTDQERLIELFSTIPLSERRSIHYSYTVSAALRLDRLTFAVNLHEEALARIPGSIGTPALLQYTIERKLWQLATGIWQQYNSRQEEKTSETSDVLDQVEVFRLPDIWEQATSALDFALHMKDLAGSETAAALQAFACQLTLRSLNVESADAAHINERKNVFGPKKIGRHKLKSGLISSLRPNVHLHEEMIHKALAFQVPPQRFFTRAISQVLRFNTRAFDALALRYYRTLRDVPGPHPNHTIVSALLHRLCSIRSSAGIFMVLNDYRFYFGDVPPFIHEMVIPALAKEGNRQAVEDLMQEYHSKVPIIGRSHMANALLYVSNRRGETSRLPELFQRLDQEYGFQPDWRSWRTVIASYARIGDVDEATKWFNAHLDSHIKPGPGTFIYMMSMFAKRGDLDAVKQLLRQSTDLDVPIEIGMIDCLVLAQVHNEDLSSAEKLVMEALNTVEDVPKSSRTRMWNYLLNAYGLKGNIEKVTMLHRCMRENEVPSDAITFAALMQCLAIRQRLQGVSQILMDIMPQADVQPSALHYGILMSGYLRKKQYRKVFELYSQMLEKGLKPTTGTQNYLVRAAAQSDAQQRDNQSGQNGQPQHERAQRALEQTIADMDTMDLATTEPVKFVGNLRLDEAFLSSYFTYMINIYGRARAFDKAKELYDRYVENCHKFDMDVETSPPIQMLSALMIASRKAGDHDAVEKCWNLSLEKAQTLARSANTNISEPGWVLPARRYILNIHLRYYISSLAAQQRFKDIDKTVDHLLHCGYSLDSRSWNQYIVLLLQSGKRLKAFQMCERELIPGWQGWAYMGWVSIGMQDRGQKRQSTHLAPHRRHPQYETIVHLAAAFVGAQSESKDRWGRTEIERLAKAAPSTVHAVYNLPRLDDYLQGNLLKEV